MTTPQDDFSKWLLKWMELARFTGNDLPDPDLRIHKLLQLWREPIPDFKPRTSLPVRIKLGEVAYSRGNKKSQKANSEHELEKLVFDAQGPLALFKFSAPSQIYCLANAYPLANGRKVEADALAIAKTEKTLRIYIVEVKTSTNNPWYAVVENLRQLKLFQDGLTANLALLNLKEHLKAHFSKPLWASKPETRGMVLARESFFTANGQKKRSGRHALKLTARFKTEFEVHVEFAILDSANKISAPFDLAKVLSTR